MALRKRDDHRWRNRISYNRARGIDIALIADSHLDAATTLSSGRRIDVGGEYVESLRDGRRVYLCGERIADVTTHPALGNSVRSIARRRGVLDQCIELVDEGLADYDIDGWKNDAWR